MQIKKYCIYKHINNINKKVYIGQTCQIPTYRWGRNGEGYKNSPHFYESIKKYGWENFSHEILYTDLTKEEANLLEKQLIQKYKSRDPKYGYNSQIGGNEKIPNEITRKRQSIAAQNRPPVSEQTKEKLSKVSKGLKRSEKTKIKMSQAAKKRQAQHHGTRQLQVQCLNNHRIFPSLRAAADWCNLVGTSGIASVCKGGKQKTAGVDPITHEKLKWRYVNDQNS